VGPASLPDLAARVAPGAGQPQSPPLRRGGRAAGAANVRRGHDRLDGEGVGGGWSWPLLRTDIMILVHGQGRHQEYILQ
jgi:hypothetical protein